MASSDSKTKDPHYCRKDKSLALLCTNFLKLYDRDGVEFVGLDDASFQLGVERRRMYDIVNILEGIGVLQKKGKGQYTWKGFAVIPEALNFLKDQGLKGEFGAYVSDFWDWKKLRLPTGSKPECPGKFYESDEEPRRERSLVLLTQNFVKLFLCSDVELISLDHAALALVRDSQDPAAIKTKVRRLYDIANVLTSMGLLEKTCDLESAKPAYRWKGMGRGCIHGSSIALDARNSKRREFATDISNTVVKRRNIHSSFDWKSNEKENMENCSKNIVKSVKDGLSTKQHQKHDSKDFVFGPFIPNVIDSAGHGNKIEGQIQEWANLIGAYRPQYCNQVIHNLFHHYAQAWELWHAEAEDKQQTQPGS